MDSILIEQLEIQAIIGVYAAERQQPQTLWLDLELFPTQSHQNAAHSDALTDTIDYAAVCHHIQSFIHKTQFQLLETLAEQVAQLLLHEFKINRCQITVFKKPFDLTSVKSVAVKIERGVEALTQKNYPAPHPLESVGH